MVCAQTAVVSSVCLFLLCQVDNMGLCSFVPLKSITEVVFCSVCITLRLPKANHSPSTSQFPLTESTTDPNLTFARTLLYLHFF